MKIFLIILLCVIGWIISGFLSALIIKNVFDEDVVLLFCLFRLSSYYFCCGFNNPSILVLLYFN